ncbi:MAG: TlyA family RNA methyltransferase, partial [Candidatus Atribacteria bacterium]|nr:TlyA family RNA methyltransferase [Candidatus Atribacteria bacterium]
MAKKERLDKLLIDRKVIGSREKAQRLIMANLVLVNGVKVNKVGTKCDVDSEILIQENNDRYVSRGGRKLEKALNYFHIDVKGYTVIDVGASTGGFTDCLLQNEASKIYCIDVGYGQLDWNLRNDNRIVNMEKTNIRYLKRDQLTVQFDLATIDVSFISLTKVLPVVKDFLKENGKVVALVKPQFEAGRENIEKGGLVKNPEIHVDVLEKLLEAIRKYYRMIDMTFSPIKNSPGNIEYLIYLAENNQDDQWSV